jgi:hypothetical protein
MAHLLAELKSKVTVVESTTSTAPSTRNPAYGDPKYWDERYDEDGPDGTIFEWLLDWNDLEPVLVPELRKWGAAGAESRILHPGCGNSSLGTELRLQKFGQGGVLNTDISPTVVSQMQKQFLGCSYLVDDCLDMRVARTWAGVDVLSSSGGEEMPELTVSPGKFDVAVDKGTLDALACTEGTASVKSRVVSQYLDELAAVLKSTGALLVVSFGQPETRRNYFLRSGWRLIGEPTRVQKRLRNSTNQGDQELKASATEATTSEEAAAVAAAAPPPPAAAAGEQQVSGSFYFLYVAVPPTEQPSQSTALPSNTDD